MSGNVTSWFPILCSDSHGSNPNASFLWKCLVSYKKVVDRERDHFASRKLTQNRNLRRQSVVRHVTVDTQYNTATICTETNQITKQRQPPRTPNISATSTAQYSDLARKEARSDRRNVTKWDRFAVSRIWSLNLFVEMSHVNAVQTVLVTESWVCLPAGYDALPAMRPRFEMPSLGVVALSCILQHKAHMLLSRFCYTFRFIKTILWQFYVWGAIWRLYRVGLALIPKEAWW